jgi:hypothetical protein
VNKFFPGITDPLEANVAANSWVGVLKGLRWRNNDLIYPNMNEGLLLDNLQKLIIAVNTGDYEVLNEWNGVKRNKDLVCDACGNLELSAVLEGGTMCGADRKEQRLIRQLYPERHKTFVYEKNTFTSQDCSGRDSIERACDRFRNRIEYKLPNIEENHNMCGKERIR